MQTIRADSWLRCWLAGTLGAVALSSVVQAVPIANEVTVYSNTFSGPVGGEWSDTRKGTTPLQTQFYGDFLGQFSRDGEDGDEGVTLTLVELPPGMYHLSFDLLIIKSWDGIEEYHNAVADRWSMGLDGHDLMLLTSFSNNLNQQTFPDPFDPAMYNQANPNLAARYTGSKHAATSMANEKNSLGFTFPGVGIQDAVYKMDFTFPLESQNMVLRFAGLGLDGVADAGWGLDNVVVARVPEPAALVIAALGTLAVLIATHRARRRCT